MTAKSWENQPLLFGHPMGLYVLFMTELWERFSYYGMRAILSLYLAAEAVGNNPGMGWTDKETLALYGWYTMLVYVASIPGGIIADRLLGQKQSVMVGGGLLCIGHLTLAFPNETAFIVGLGFIIAGVGMLKPNISTMVGGLYAPNDERRDKGFSIFYMGINVGAAAASLIVGVVASEFGWHYGFGLAGIGMLIGQAIFIGGQKYLTTVGNKPVKDKVSPEVSLIDLYQRLLKSPLQRGVTAVMTLFSLYWMATASWSYGLLFLFLSLVAGMMMSIYQDLNKVERDRYVVLLLSFIIVIVFWGAFEQAGGLMNLYTESKTDRTILGLTIPAAVMQSFNPIYILIFAVPVAGFWYNRKVKNREASSIFKMAIGVIIMGLGFTFMVGASLQYEALGQSAIYWLALAYLFHTIGELCASPVAMSFITKLAPVKYGSLMMGVYFASTGLGNKVAGILGESASDFGELAVFSAITIFCVLFGLLVVALLKPLKRLTHGAEDFQPIDPMGNKGPEIEQVEERLQG
jgi:proton-dependent oligopeptide transporter, POT family